MVKTELGLITKKDMLKHMMILIIRVLSRAILRHYFPEGTEA